ncbi:hypothetical protein NP493_1182g00009 [Ridgeia piscesae]|uniref:Uncharacterized protein n=1 Tax=Ridgeia piscesae TaxID=27915 RepID=A0AAD9KE52_RIDPI|nr:hypothetical protein NP493_1182g00009 [Ridgeia piscesae]
MTGSDVINVIGDDSTYGRYFLNEKAISATNISTQNTYISQSTLAAMFNQWSSLESDLSLERSCVGEDEPPRWEARRATDIRLGEVTAALLDDLQWDDVVILTDGASDDVLPKYDRVGGRPATYSIFPVKVGQEARDIEEAFDLVAEFRERHFIIACAMNCSKEVFNQANTFDMRRNQQGFFTYLHKWIVVAKHQSQLAEIEFFLGNVSNVVAVVLPNTALPILQWQMDELRSSTRALVSTTADDHHLIIDTAYLSRTAAFNLSSSPTYGVFTALYQRDGRRFQEVGSYVGSTLRLTGDQELFPNVKFGLNGRHLLVTTNYWGPFMKKTIINGHATYVGLCYDMLKEMATTMNFSFTVTEPPDGQWGAFSNGSYTGLIGQMQRKEADMIAAPISRQIHREKYMDFAEVPFYLEFTTVAIREPDPDDNTVGLFFQPFKLEVWVFILVVIPISGVALLLYVRAYRVALPQRQKETRLHNVIDAQWYAVGAILQQGCEHRPGSLAVRFVFGGWWLFCIIIVATYGANLVAFLAVTQRTMPFNSLEEMSEQTVYKMGTLGGTAWVAFFEFASLPVYKHIWTSMKRIIRHDPDIISTNHTLHMQKVDTERYVYIVDVTSIRAEMATNCHMTMLDLRFMPLPYSVGFHNNTAYKPLVNEAFGWFFAAGLFGRWREKYWPKPAQCATQTGPKALGLYHLQGAFYITFGFIVVSCLVLVLEVVISAIAASCKKYHSDTVSQGDNILTSSLFVTSYSVFL